MESQYPAVKATRRNSYFQNSLPRLNTYCLLLMYMLKIMNSSSRNTCTCTLAIPVQVKRNTEIEI